LDGHLAKKNVTHLWTTIENIDTYIQVIIHLLAMPEICCFSLKTFETVGSGKGPTNLQIGWTFFGPWFIHQKIMRDSLKHF